MCRFFLVPCNILPNYEVSQSYLSHLSAILWYYDLAKSDPNPNQLLGIHPIPGDLLLPVSRKEAQQVKYKGTCTAAEETRLMYNDKPVELSFLGFLPTFLWFEEHPAAELKYDALMDTHAASLKDQVLTPAPITNGTKLHSRVNQAFENPSQPWPLVCQGTWTLTSPEKNFNVTNVNWFIKLLLQYFEYWMKKYLGYMWNLSWASKWSWKQTYRRMNIARSCFCGWNFITIPQVKVCSLQFSRYQCIKL